MPTGDDDRTLLVPRSAPPGGGLVPVDIQYPGPDGKPRNESFTSAFVVGRGEDCAVRLAVPEVSRHHLEIFPQDDCWWARDLASSNGTLVNERPIDRLQLLGTVTLQLGRQGPRMRVTAPPPAPASAPAPAPAPASPEGETASLEDISKHYFGDRSGRQAGEHTMLIRKAFKDVRRRQSRVYRAFIAVAVLMLAGLSGVALFQYAHLQRMAALANDIFYSMKELELHIANLEDEVQRDQEVAQNTQMLEEIAESKRKLARMREDYESYARELQASRFIAPDSEELLILHIARTFGETEVDVPTGFMSEVKKYIKKWQSSGRLASAIRRLKENSYAPTIVAALASQELPPQFIYVALQETNFNPRAIGPSTRYGYAKGMWQFIPSTGARYGLRLGPLEDSRTYDPADERHDFRKATYAAARYLKDIYRTDAQASGLLVIASYNWGEGNIIKRLRSMPENPRERNFWELLRRYNIPKETYDYVFYIFSAAVICENPRFFGFDFDNPLANM